MSATASNSTTYDSFTDTFAEEQPTALWNIRMSNGIFIQGAGMYRIYGDYLAASVDKQRFSIPIAALDQLKQANDSFSRDPRVLASLMGVGLGGAAGALTGIPVLPIFGATAGFLTGYHLAGRRAYQLRNLSIEDRKEVLRRLINQL